MKTWWEALSVRERGILMVGVALTLLLLLYVLVWEPFRSNSHRLQQQVAAQRADLAWMLQAAQDVKRLGGSAESAPAAGDDRSLLTLVDQTARTAGLGPALKRIAPQGDDKLSAQLDGVEFDKLIPWLAELEKTQHLTIVNLSVDRTGTTGLVNARIVVGKPL